MEYEQNGSLRAEYGKAVLQEISEKLLKEFGGGFSVRNPQQMKKFYMLVPNTNALRSQLTWTHYRALLRIENDDDRVEIRLKMKGFVKEWSALGKMLRSY